MKGISLRLIEERDLKATRNIYSKYVETTAISFEYDPPDMEEWKNRVKTISADYPWLIAEVAGEVVGYAYGSKHRTRAAYSWSVESTVYISESFHRRGVARALYQLLFDILRLQGFMGVYAGITLPNLQSVRFHEAMGFNEVGRFKNVGYKFNQWYDTYWLQLHLHKPDSPFPPPRRVTEILHTTELNMLLQKANE